MSLNSVNIGMNKYCGPAVLSILTGKSTDECARVISSINGKYTIEGVKTTDLLQAAERLGFDHERVIHSASLFGSLIRLVNSDGIYIVAITKHFVTIEVKDRKIWFCDNHTKEPMPAAGSARLEQQVQSIHKVTKRREPLKLSAKFLVDKRQSGDEIEIQISQKIIYDIEKYNNEILVARFKLANREDFDEFVKQLTTEEF